MSKKSKKRDKDRKRDGKRRDEKKVGSEAGKLIARAEKRLQKSLAKVDEARAELAEREFELRALLIEYARMPAEVDTSGPEVESSQVGGHEQSQDAAYPLAGADDDSDQTEGDVSEVFSVLLFDQRQVLDVGLREPVRRDE